MSINKNICLVDDAAEFFNHQWEKDQFDSINKPFP